MENEPRPTSVVCGAFYALGFAVSWRTLDGIMTRFGGLDGINVHLQFFSTNSSRAVRFTECMSALLSLMKVTAGCVRVADSTQDPVNLAPLAVGLVSTGAPLRRNEEYSCNLLGYTAVESDHAVGPMCSVSR